MAEIVVCRTEDRDAVVDTVIEIARISILTEDARLLFLGDDATADDGRTLTMVFDFDRRSRAEAFVSALAADERTATIERRLLHRRPPIAVQMPMIHMP